MTDNSDRRVNVLYNKLDSNKIKERKDAFEDLKVLLTESNWTAVLDRNSDPKNRNGIGWNQIFSAAHNGALKEAELCLKDDTSRAKKIFNVKFLISVISSLATRANTDVERLASSTVISNVLDAFENAFCREIFSEGYSKLLHDCILTRKKYWAEISPVFWIDLLKCFKVLLEEATTENSKCTLISCLNLICLHGSNCAQFFPHIHKLLKELPEILDKIDMDSTPRLQINVVEFCLTICQQIKEEYRLTVCKFGEIKFPQFLMLYQSRDNANKKELIAKLLIEIIEVHHPCGLPAGSPGALASSWELWKSQLKELYECLENQISSITNSRNVLSPYEVHLAVICAKQVFSETSLHFNYQESLDTECAVKKRKLNSGVENLIGVLESKNVADIAPLLIFIEALMARHPEMFSSEDFFKLLDFSAEKLPVCNVPNVTTQLCRIIIQLVSLEENLEVNENSKEILRLWSTIWNSSMNFLSLSKQIGLRQPSEETHPLVRALLKRGCQSFMADSLLNLYSNGVLPFSDECLKTFVCLCQNFAITENLELRLKLLKWFVVDRDLEECSLASLCAQAILALSLKSKLPVEHVIEQDKKWKDSELYFLSTSLEKLPENPKKLQVEQRSIIEHTQVISAMINLLKEKQENFIGVTDLLVVIPYTTVLVVIASSFQKHKISFSNKINILLDESLNMLWPSLTSQFNESREEVMSELLKAANILFTALVQSPHFAAKKDIKTMSDNLSKIFFQDYSNPIASQTSKMLGFDVFEDACHVDSSAVPQIQLNALKLIVHLDTINSICNNKFEIDILLQKMNEKIDYSSSKGFKIVLTILEMMVAREKVQSDNLTFVMYLLNNLYKKHYKNHEDFLTIMNLTKSAIHHFYMSEEISHHDGLCNLMTGSSRIIVTKNKYDGPKIVKGFLDVLIPMVKIDRGYKWKIEYGGNEEDIPTALHVLEYFKSPFNQVRFKAAEYIPVIFQDKKPSQDLLEIQKIAFAKLMESVSELFFVKDLDEEDLEEESIKRGCCALNIISTIISNSCTWRRKAVFKLVALICAKKIRRSLVKRVLNQIQADMKLKNVIKFLEQNLEYVIFKWYSLYKNFTEFPFSMLDCLDKKEFYIKYKNYVVPPVVFSRDGNVLSEIAKVSGVEIISLIKECFGHIFTDYLSCLTDANQARMLQTYLTKMIGASAFQELWTQNFEKSIVGLYGKLNDYENFIALCGDEHSVAFPEKIPSDIDRQRITVGLKYLQDTSSSKDVDLLVMVGTDHPEVLYNIMHALFTSITQATCHEIRALYFSQYITFCDDLLKNFIKLKRMGGFILRQLTHALLHFCESELATPVLYFMHRAIKVSMPHSTRIVNDLLPHIVPNMVSFVKNDIFTSGAAMRVLQLLLVEHRAYFESVDNFDPLPQSEKFSSFKYFESRRNSQCLQEAIENFLKAGSQNLNPAFRIEGLEHLNRQLISHKKELEKLYEDLKMSRGFSEDCRQSPIHRLIISLVRLTTCKNQEISKLAAKCLGEIGPCDLSTLVLLPEPHTKPPSFLLKIVHLLLPLLVHNDPALVSSTATVFLELFNTQEGFEIKDSLTIHEKCYIFPFFPKTKKVKKPQNLNPSEHIISGLSNLCPINKFISHDDWIVNLVVSILSSFDENTYLHSLIKIIKSQVNIAEEILPYLVYKLLKQNDKELTSKIEEMINLFFKRHFDLKNAPFQDVQNAIYLNRASVQCMLKVINFYRQEETFSEIKLKRVLEIDYLYAARAAQFCNAYFTSVLYAELWIEETLRSSRISEDVPNMSPLEKICRLKRADATNLQNLLWEAYKEIGEYDAVYGCGDIRLVDTSGRIKFYSQMGLWSKVIEECEINQDANCNQDLINALRFNGSLNAAMSVSYRSQPDYDCAWRLADWSLVPKEETYSGSIYGALKAIKNNDVTTALQFVDHARDLVISNLEHASLEVANSIYQPLSRLRVLRELEECERNDSSRWRNESGRWIDFEPIYCQRGLLVKRESLPEVLLNMAEKATQNESYLIAQRCLNEILKIKPDKNVVDKINMKIAQLSWMTGDTSRAKYLMKNLMDENNKTEPSILIESLLTYGSWMADSKSEPIQMIMDNYFKKAKDKLEGKVNTCKELHSAAECLGKYSYAEYLRLKQYINSTEFNELRQNTDLSKKKLDEFKGGNRSIIKDNDYLKAEKSYAVQINLADKESQSIKEKMNLNLQSSIIYYLKCLIYGEGDSNDLKMFRFVSLLLNSSSQIKNMDEIRELLQKVTSYKFIIVLPQLAARISDDDLPFSQMLNDIILTCCKEHPYHALPTILALVNSHKDEQYLEHAPKKRPIESLKPRVRGAMKLYKLLTKEDKIKDIVLKMDILFLSYISLANCKISQNMKPGDYKIPNTETIRKMKDLKNLPCTTTNIPISPSGDYSDIVYIKGFEEVYSLIGGINQPKKVKCICSDGISREQLVKGKDDLRQDAVMQQVFKVMNILLRSEEQTACRKLLIRTYKVVPLSQRSGIIEWVNNTMPLSEYLAGHSTAQGAHQKYRPKDYSPMECRIKMIDVKDKDADTKLKMYLTLCKQMKPVFRHFFTEKFPTPSLWFESRLAYTRSIATNSMIGYILGIGDRHAMNILLDLKTAEVIHIDFGIAFEQAQILPTPETVPFRLTRDIVDGMGVTGVEGVFRRCCEETVRVLRKCQEPILTTLEVLLYDPLYTWTINPKKAQNLQSENIKMNNTVDSEEKSSEELNSLALWALQRLKQKFEGREEGSTTGVEGQVNYLINKATDPANLSVLYHGWQACL